MRVNNEVVEPIAKRLHDEITKVGNDIMSMKDRLIYRYTII
ncbi:MAG TPA: hypothetical protein VHF28_07165 [Nitrososphaera sp.]|nr:hypothetical protein [Nitrososphaera sp.]